MCCTNCCSCTDKVNGDGPVILNDNGDVWNVTHELASSIFTPVDIPDAPVEVILEDIVNDPTSPNYIGGGF